MASFPPVKMHLENLKESIGSLDLTSAINKINHYLDKQEHEELTIGVTGESGSGKSSFVNALRGLGDDDEGSAKTGVVETTMKPEVYLHPKHKNVKVWDLPGIGTPNFQADKYLEQVNIQCYDVFIIIASDRFKECHKLLAKEIIGMGKKFYFVRSKIDLSIAAEKRKRKANFDEKNTLHSIREDCENGLREINVKDSVVFLISSWELEKYDFNLLEEKIEKDLPQHKRDVLLLALPNITLEINEKKKKAQENNIARVAFLSACVAAVPVPGLSIAVDLAILIKETERYFKVFGLDDESLQNLCERSGKSIDYYKSLMKSPLHAGINAASLIPMLEAASVAVTVVKGTLACVLSLIPVICSLTAGGISFYTVSAMLHKALDDIEEDARNVLLDLVQTKAQSESYILIYTFTCVYLAATFNIQMQINHSKCKN